MTTVPQNALRALPFFLAALLAAAFASPAAAQNNKKKLTLSGASWIWKQATSNDGEVCYFRKTFDAPATVKSARLIASADNAMKVSLNGKQVVDGTTWEKPQQANVKSQLKAGENVLTVEASNAGGIAGFIAKLEVQTADGKTINIVTDKSWQVAGKADGAGDVDRGVAWQTPHVHGKYGTGPWGTLPKRPGQVAAAIDSPVSLDGFVVDKLYEVPKGEQGSWVAITFDPKGRLVASDQGGQGLFRVTLPKVDDANGEVNVEKIPVNFSSAQGMTFAFGALYANKNGGGLHRITDSDGDGELDKVELIMPLRGGGEHGPHAVIPTEDGKALYVIGGNHTDPPSDLAATRMPPNWSEDLLLPRQWDARGHARGKLAPGGWIARVSPDGKERVLISNGYRNEYDIALNRDGELFTYDADMEWDLGAPWYRPTRINHVTSGSEYGWRSGTGKWPEYYPDSLPPVVNIGPGSPVGVTFGYGAKFPAKYQDALYALDWTYGTIWAIHLEPDGASYKATKEDFVWGRPLQVTDAEIGPDGCMYFTVGGRGSQSALYRVKYMGDKSTAPSKGNDNPQARDARALRKQLEAFHGEVNPSAVGVAWQHLGSDDRFIRFAARIAIEHQPARTWQARVFAEKDPTALIEAAVALARQGDNKLQPKLLDKLNALKFDSLDTQQQLALLRAYALTFIRMGKPTPELAAVVAEKLDAHYPSDNSDVNRELCRVLVYLDSPTVVTKTLKLMAEAKPTPPTEWVELAARNPGYGGAVIGMLQNMPNQQNIHYAFCLRNVRYGWSLEQRRQYFQWFIDAAKSTKGGASYQGFLENIRKEALANCSNAERAALADITGENLVAQPIPSELPKPKGPGKAWTIEELTKLTEGGLRKRDFENGKRAYAAAQCVLCHRFDGEGGAVGPDLTGVVSRFSYHDLLENIITPSKVVSDQYESSVIDTLDGPVAGRIVEANDDTVSVITDPYKPSKITVIKRADIDKIRVSKSSIMPSDLLNGLNKEEVLDLLAYLMSRGDKNDRVFR